MPRQDDPSHPGTIGTAQHRPKVSWISDAITDEQEGTRVLEQLLNTDGRETSGEGEDSLVTFGARFAVETRHGNQLNRHPLTLRLEFNRVKNVRRILSVGHVDFLHGATARL